MFEMAAEGVPDAQIIAELDANGVTTIRGAKVGKTTLPNVIANRFYLGEVHNDGVWFPAKHKCLIDPELWQRAQRDRQAKRGPKPKDYVHLLDGLLVTSHYRLTYPENRKGQACPFFTKYNKNRHGTIYFNYARGDRIDRHGGIEVEPTDELAADLPVYINAEDLDNKIVAWLLDEANTGALAAAIQQARMEVRDRGDDVEEDIKQLRRQITEATKKRDSLKRKVVELVQDDQMAAVRAVNDELEAADRHVELLNSRCQGLEAAVARLADAELEMDAIDDNVTLIRRGWEEGNRVAIRALLRSIIQEIDIRMDGIVIKVYALPGMRVYELGGKVAETEELVAFMPKRKRNCYKAAC